MLILHSIEVCRGESHMKPGLVNASDNEGKKEREDERGLKRKYEKWGTGIMIMIHRSSLRGWLQHRVTRCTIVM